MLRYSACMPLIHKKLAYYIMHYGDSSSLLNTVVHNSNKTKGMGMRDGGWWMGVGG